MSRIPPSKAEEIQRKYTDQLDDFLNISMSDVQVKQWTVALCKYSEDVLREGWNMFLYKVRPGLMPSIEDCTKIMNDLQAAHSRQVHESNKEEIPQTVPGQVEGFSRWMKAVAWGLKPVATNRWTELTRLEYMLDMATKCGLGERDLTEMKIELEEYRRRNLSAEESPI